MLHTFTQQPWSLQLVAYKKEAHATYNTTYTVRIEYRFAMLQLSGEPE